MVPGDLWTPGKVPEAGVDGGLNTFMLELPPKIQNKIIQ